jgi:hypothetical protein
MPTRENVSTAAGEGLFILLCVCLRLLRRPVADREQLALRDSFRSQHFSRITAASRRVRSADASVVSLKCDAEVRRVLDRVCQNADAVADIAFDVIEVLRFAAPLAAMEGHHLHQSTRAHEASRPRIEVAGLDEHHSDKKCRIDFLLATLYDDSPGDSISQISVASVPSKDLAEAE